MAHTCDHNNEARSAQNDLEQRMKSSLSKITHKILVMSGKGGVGKSTAAVNIALALAKAGFKTGLLDVDLHGPSIPQLTGLVGIVPESDGDRVMPLQYNDKLSILSMGSFLPGRDDAVIWRGPLKIGAIRQFVGDANWGELDFLVIDSPPGTGDEPLTIAQDITGVQAVVVTTPQEVSLADVRKSITFCRKVNMPILGVIENMSGFVCSKCGNIENLFGAGGGEKMAKMMSVPFLGKIPIDTNVVASGEKGVPLIQAFEGSPAAVAFNEIVQKFIDRLNKCPQTRLGEANETAAPKPKKDGEMNIVVPTAQGVLCNHFGHSEKFAMVHVVDGKIVGTDLLDPPAHEPGVIPKWLSGEGANVIIAGGMGARAQELFAGYGIEVLVGVANSSPEELVMQYLQGVLKTGENVCDH